MGHRGMHGGGASDRTMVAKLSLKPVQQAGEHDFRFCFTSFFFEITKRQKERLLNRLFRRVAVVLS